MTEYKFKMIVLEAVSMEYTVEADSTEEAEEKALSGETIHEENLGHIGVEDRQFDIEE